MFIRQRRCEGEYVDHPTVSPDNLVLLTGNFSSVVGPLHRVFPGRDLFAMAVEFEGRTLRAGTRGGAARPERRAWQMRPSQHARQRWIYPNVAAPRILGHGD